MSTDDFVGEPSSAEAASETNELVELLVLQDEDVRLDQLAYQRVHLEERVELERLLAEDRSLKNKAAKVTAERDLLVDEQVAIEQRVAAIDQRRSAIEARLHGAVVPSFRDQDSMANELASLAKQKQELEDRELELMEALEPLELELEGLSDRQAGLRAAIGSQQRALSLAEAAIDAEVALVAGQRASIASNITANLLDEYEKLRGRLGGIGAARVEHGTCSGCRLQLPATELDRIRHAAPGSLWHCDQCGRILVA